MDRTSDGVADLHDLAGVGDASGERLSLHGPIVGSGSDAPRGMFVGSDRRKSRRREPNRRWCPRSYKTHRVSSGRRIRRAARALVVDEQHRALLARLEFPMWQGWVLPGGGIEDGEDEVVAIRRELAEEIGLADADLVGPIWERTVLFSDPVSFDGQTDRIWFVRCAFFHPTPALPWDVLNGEGMTDLRWWTRDEIATSGETFAPRRLASLLHDLIENGLPATIVDVGE